MIILDYSQIVISSYFAELKGNFESDLFKHIIFNSIRAYKKKFSTDYGTKMILAVDAKDNWRKQIFPEYKVRRAAKKKDDDWDKIYATMQQVKDDIINYFPYNVIEVDGAEGDDIIGVIVAATNEKTIVVSSDKDFKQLCRYPHFRQYSHMDKSFVKTDDADIFLKEHIIRGDSGDDIPNVLSPEKVFVMEGVRQKSIFKDKMKDWLTLPIEEFLDEDQIKRFHFNQKLIDLSFVPDDIQKQILEKFNRTGNLDADMSSMMHYFSRNRMRHLLDVLEDF